jgi:hypothetical protein
LWILWQIPEHSYLQPIPNQSPFPQDVDEEENKQDAHFRYITEITILTVQLIVEFAKGLPAFTKIPQEDQITLLKVTNDLQTSTENEFHLLRTLSPCRHVPVR